MQLDYKKEQVKKDIPSRVYKSSDFFGSEHVKKSFLKLKTNVCDLNPALVAKCVIGTEQDFIGFMNRAQDYIKTLKKARSNESELMDMFRECVFGYYVLSPLIQDKKVSDIKVLAYDKIVVKADGDRLTTDISFLDEADYEAWLSRFLRRNRVSTKNNALIHFTDRVGDNDCYLRIDVELSSITSNEITNVHIRKMPKTKLTWDYLKDNGMIDDDGISYITNRIKAGYGFLISGRGGSGKSTLLNQMIDLIPFNESVLVSQESDELYSNVHPQIQFEHTLEDSGILLEDELRLGLLQDIDNFVIGEIKGAEALYVFTTALSTGARFFGTIHSNDARSSVTRLAQCARYISDYPMETLEEMLGFIPFVLIHLSRFSIDEIVEVKGFDDKRKCLIYHQVYRKENV